MRHCQFPLCLQGFGSDRTFFYHISNNLAATTSAGAAGKNRGALTGHARLLRIMAGTGRALLNGFKLVSRKQLGTVVPLTVSICPLRNVKRVHQGTCTVLNGTSE